MANGITRTLFLAAILSLAFISTGSAVKVWNLKVTARALPASVKVKKYENGKWVWKRYTFTASEQVVFVHLAAKVYLYTRGEGNQRGKLSAQMTSCDLVIQESE